MRGQHAIKPWSSTQRAFALPSGEAAYYGKVRGGYVGLEMQAAWSDVGVEPSTTLRSDAGAAAAMASRGGLGDDQAQRSTSTAAVGASEDRMRQGDEIQHE